jgi:hypothetical protein
VFLFSAAVARFVGAVKAARSNFPHGDFSMTTFSLSRKTLLSLFTASAVSMTSLAFAQTAATAPDAAPPPPTTAASHDGPMQEGTAATSAPATNPAPMASTDKPKSWKELDANKDGKLSKDEVAGDATWTADFDTADTNKDGFLSKSEYKKHESDLKKVASNDKK